MIPQTPGRPGQLPPLPSIVNNNISNYNTASSSAFYKHIQHLS